MGKAVATTGQGFFVFGMDPRTTVLMDATRELATGASQQVVAGFPLSLCSTGADQGKIIALAVNTGDPFFGVSGVNRNNLYGGTTLGEWQPGAAVAYLAGIFTIRKSVFLDTNNTEQTINPFKTSFPIAANIGSVVGVEDVALGGTEAALLGAISLNKWIVGAPGGTHDYTNVGVILDVREDSEVDLYIPMQVNLAA
jgi:hypothetical protein